MCAQTILCRFPCFIVEVYISGNARECHAQIGQHASRGCPGPKPAEAFVFQASIFPVAASPEQARDEAAWAAGTNDVRTWILAGGMIGNGTIRQPSCRSLVYGLRAQPIYHADGVLQGSWFCSDTLEAHSSRDEVIAVVPLMVERGGAMQACQYNQYPCAIYVRTKRWRDRFRQRVEQIARVPQSP